MPGHRWFVVALAVLGLSACATSPREVSPQVFYEVPCDMPGAFRADVRPVALETGPPPTGAPTPAPSSSSPPARPPSAQPLCLAQAGVVPRSYARRAYRYYDDYWWPYRARGSFGFGIGLGHHGGGHHRVSHHGGGHHGGGRRH